MERQYTAVFFQNFYSVQSPSPTDLSLGEFVWQGNSNNIL